MEPAWWLLELLTHESACGTNVLCGIISQFFRILTICLALNRRSADCLHICVRVLIINHGILFFQM